ncbi:MAG: triose-phosphate isomerase [Betaproteobacteria bacterium]|nr:triose-phosphate isomerase [Gammaproteobacteria bacterium]MDH3438371.1 triose-phosphate isomerase [Betaproteobacteria bacterium]
MRRPLVAGNWKMNGGLDDVRRLLAGIIQGHDVSWATETVVCPPFVYLPAAAAAMEGTALVLGAQNASEHLSGAFTGEVAVEMLADFGCRYVIVGHSERRAGYAESDALVAKKFSRVIDAGLAPILCVGETLEERESEETESVIARQLDAVLEQVGAAAMTKGVVAYEPVWAIGTGRNASPEQANAVHAFIRHRLAAKGSGGAAEIRIVYGGSVKASNCEALFAMPEIDGGLIGGASLKADEFLTICQTAG